MNNQKKYSKKRDTQTFNEDKERENTTEQVKLGRINFRLVNKV